MYSMPEFRNHYNNFGDLYLSLADYSTFESVSFEKTLFLEILFRKTIYVEESAFFIAGSQFAALALNSHGPVHSAIKEGVIVPLTKGEKAPSFKEIVDRFPHVKRKDPSLRPESLFEDMPLVAMRYDRMYASDSASLRTRSITPDQLKFYNADLQSMLQASTPPSGGTPRQVRVLGDMWAKSYRFRDEFVRRAVREAEEKELASVPKTTFYKCAAELMNITYVNPEQLMAEARKHPQGPELIAFLRWIHEIFYYSRARSLGSATTYAMSTEHVTLPFLHAAPPASGSGSDSSDTSQNAIEEAHERSFVECEIQLPTTHALQNMRQLDFMGLRDRPEARSFFDAVTAWQVDLDASSRKDLIEALKKYAAVLCQEAAKSGHSSVVTDLVRIDAGPLKSVVRALGVAGSAASFLPSVLAGGTHSASSTAGVVSASIAALSFLHNRKAHNASTYKAKSRIYDNGSIDVDTSDMFLSG